MDEQIFAARDVSKCSTYKVGAFEGTEYGCIGKVTKNRVLYAYCPIRPHTTASEFDVTGLEQLPKVEIVYGYSDCSTTLLKAAAETGAQGIVYAAPAAEFCTPTCGSCMSITTQTIPFWCAAPEFIGVASALIISWTTIFTVRSQPGTLIPRRPGFY